MSNKLRITIEMDLSKPRRPIDVKWPVSEDIAEGLLTLQYMLASAMKIIHDHEFRRKQQKDGPKVVAATADMLNVLNNLKKGGI